MSVDYNIKPTGPAQPAPAIENELPAYRAISRGAVFALLFGVLSLLSFASFAFLAFAVLAVVCGFRADRKIQRMPEALTGRGIAQAGLGLGLLFGLTAVTISLVQGMVRVSRAETFAREYEQVLTKGSFDDFVFYSINPANRADKTPAELVKEMKGGGQPQAFEMQTEPWARVHSALTAKQPEVHFKEIETHGIDGLTPYAAAVYEVHNPRGDKEEEKEALILVFMKAVRTGADWDWWVENVAFPYKPKTFVAPVSKPAGDGHDHGEGGHSH